MTTKWTPKSLECETATAKVGGWIYRREGGILSTAIFNSDIQPSDDSLSCFLSVCPFVALLKATYAENSHIVLSCRH